MSVSLCTLPNRRKRSTPVKSAAASSHCHQESARVTVPDAPPTASSVTAMRMPKAWSASFPRQSSTSRSSPVPRSSESWPVLCHSPPKEVTVSSPAPLRTVSAKRPPSCVVMLSSPAPVVRFSASMPVTQEPSVPCVCMRGRLRSRISGPWSRRSAAQVSLPAPPATRVSPRPLSSRSSPAPPSSVSRPAPETSASFCAVPRRSKRSTPAKSSTCWNHWLYCASSVTLPPAAPRAFTVVAKATPCEWSASSPA